MTCSALVLPAVPTARLPPSSQDLPDVFSAREFVWWYNGHPNFASLPIDLSRARIAVILGQVGGQLSNRVEALFEGWLVVG